MLWAQTLLFGLKEKFGHRQQREAVPGALQSRTLTAFTDACHLPSCLLMSGFIGKLCSNRRWLFESQFLPPQTCHPLAIPWVRGFSHAVLTTYHTPWWLGTCQSFQLKMAENRNVFFVLYLFDQICVKWLPLADSGEWKMLLVRVGLEKQHFLPKWPYSSPQNSDFSQCYYHSLLRVGMRTSNS